MKIKKILARLSFIASIIIFPAAESFAVNDGDHGFQLRGALGGGTVFFGYINQGGSRGDLGTGPGGSINLAAMYNYTFLGIEANVMSGNISDLEWTDKDTSNVEHKYKSTGSGTYTVLDFKLGAKLFTEQGDMGYTFFYAGKRFWSAERSQDTLEYERTKYPISRKIKADGDGWIFGFRDFSTFGWDEGLAIVLQSGFFIGKAPVNKLTDNGVEITYSVKDSVSLGGELAAGIALQNIGLSVVGGFRGEINASSFNDSAATAEDESIFGFGNVMLFIEAGMMF